MHLPTDDQFSVPPMPQIRQRPESGRVLVLAPHPDDEAAGPGGALLLHRQQGDPVRAVVATDGIAGDPDGLYDSTTYAELRRSESRTGMAHLQVEDLVFWGFPDSCVINDNDINLIASKTCEQLEEFEPDIVYLPWEGEGNSDHRAIYCGGVRGLRRAGFSGAVWGFEIWNAMVPDMILDITPVVEQKRRAMLCYESQLAYVEYMHPVFGLHAHRSLIFNKGRGYGEGYRAVRVAEAES
jgi:LmbE family N-acetylglucosaminyl deacetylase